MPVRFRLTAPAAVLLLVGCAGFMEQFESPPPAPPPPVPQAAEAPAEAVAPAPAPAPRPRAAERPPAEVPAPTGPWTVSFEAERTEIGAEGRRTLDRAHRAWAVDPERDLVVIAPVEATPDPEQALTLSRNRARSVADALEARGVNPSRITIGTVGAAQAGAGGGVEIRLAGGDPPPRAGS